MKIVMKFGGASIATPRDMYLRANLLKKYIESNEIIVVQSAIKGVTDRLLKLIRYASNRKKERMDNELTYIKKLHIEYLENLPEKGKILDEIENMLNELGNIIYSIYYLGEATPKAQDYILSFGERLATKIMAHVVSLQGIEAIYLEGGDAGIITDSNYGDATPNMDITKELCRIRLLPLLNKGLTPIITGFIGVDKYGNITTLGRGGSDLTATLIGYSIDADEVWFWKDVPGIFSADPNIVNKPIKIPQLSYLEAAELSALGAKIIHPRAIIPLMRGNIPLRIKGFNNPDEEGTIVTKYSNKTGEIIKSITLIKDICMINIYSTNMVGVPGISGKIFSSLGKEKINILMISQNVSEANISLLIKKKDLKKSLTTLEKVMKEIGITNEIDYMCDIAAISVIGEGMRGTPGIAAKIFTCVAEKGINIIMIAQGSSEINISFVVKAVDGETAIKAIHEKLIEKN